MQFPENHTDAKFQHELITMSVRHVINALPPQFEHHNAIDVSTDKAQRRAVAAHAVIADSNIGMQPFYIIGRSFDIHTGDMNHLLLAPPRLNNQPADQNEELPFFVLTLPLGLRERFTQRKAIRQLRWLATIGCLESPHQFDNSPTTIPSIKRQIAGKKRLTPALTNMFAVPDTLHAIIRDFDLL